MNNFEDIQAGIIALLKERLALGSTPIVPEAKLFDELGVDSLDLLDLTFLIEKRFGIKLRDSGLDKLLRAEAPPGNLPPEDVRELRAWIPGLPDEVTLPQVFGYVTVESLVLLVQNRQRGSA